MRIPNLFRRKKAARLTREEALKAIPVRNPRIDWQLNDHGLVQLTVPLRQDRAIRIVRILSKLLLSQPLPETKKVELDELGSEVWQWCDGRRSVAELIHHLAARHQLHYREASDSLTQFLYHLARRGFIGLAVDVDPERARALAEEEKKHGARRHHPRGDGTTGGAH